MPLLVCFSRTTVVATAAFLDAFQKVADLATSSRGKQSQTWWGKLERCRGQTSQQFSLYLLQKKTPFIYTYSICQMIWSIKWCTVCQMPYILFIHVITVAQSLKCIQGSVRMRQFKCLWRGRSSVKPLYVWLCIMLVLYMPFLLGYFHNSHTFIRSAHLCSSWELIVQLHAWLYCRHESFSYNRHTLDGSVDIL